METCMDFRLTDEQQLWKDTLHAFMEKEVGREYTREHDESREFPEEAYRKIAEQGWLGLLVPEKLGGLRGRPGHVRDLLRGDRQVQPRHRRLRDDLDVHRDQHRPTTAPTEQQATLPPAFLAGERKFAISISEPQAGSDAARPATKAVLDGDEWVINGNKVWCSGAHLPGTVITILARTGEDRHSGMSMILVPNMNAPPIVVHARTSTPDIVTGVRIGITKAIELPWRYGLKGSRFVSKPFGNGEIPSKNQSSA